MNKIIEFLQRQSQEKDFSINPLNSNNKDIYLKAFNDIKKFVTASKAEEQKIVQLNTKPKIKKGQIWLCRTNYYDALGNEIIGNTPYLVLIVSDTHKFVNNSFIRIQPISPFTEFTANDELLIEDDSIVGFNFIVETWNEQPIMTELLDEFIGNLEVDKVNINEEVLTLSENQKKFRKVEIRNTAYLRQSISSMIEFEELKKEKTVFLNIDNSIYYPKLNNIETKTINIFTESEQEYLIAAKKGMFQNRPTYLSEIITEDFDLKIKIIKDDNNYILSVEQPKNIEIKDVEGNTLKQIGPNLYDEVKRGLYYIEVFGIENKVRLILI